jgi:Polyketide cyclase / dehydrase and lipid transport
MTGAGSGGASVKPCGRMAENSYHFMTRWHVPGTCERVADLLENVADWPRWWPAVYLDVTILRPGGPHGIGEEVALFTKGWLPYTLRWQFTVTEERYPNGFSIEARGDFVGRGVWTLEQDGEYVYVTYDWNIKAEKPLLRALTPVFRPIFSANHRWAMRMGERSLILELARLAATSDTERRAIPPPPGPTFFKQGRGRSFG